MAKGGLGKVDRDFLRRVILKNTGAKNPAVLVGPGMGLDNAVLSLGSRRVMVVTSDPLSMIPAIGMEDSAWLSVHALASDLATSAVGPQFAVLDYNLPPSLAADDLERYVEAVGSECRRLGIAIIGGHSGRYPGSDYTVVGGGMMMATAGEDEYVTPRMIQEGDVVVMTKGAAIEATAVLALAFPETTETRVGTKAARRAAGYIRRCSTLEDSLTASSVGIRGSGVTAMHDATEGGVLGGLYELASSSGRTLQIERDRIHVTRESRSVCEAFGIDPLTTISEGTLLVACRPDRSPELMKALAGSGIESFGVGVVGGSGPRLRVAWRGRNQSYVPPKLDPYWKVYSKGVRDGWR